jgi:hypothetical protein
MKIISFCLFSGPDGYEEKFTAGAISNAKLAPTIFPGWQTVLYYERSLPRHVREELLDLNVDLRDASKMDWCNKRAWRFLVNDDPTMTRYIVRDVDSRLSAREADLVYSWEQSGKPFHTIHDHPDHKNPVLAGLWGSVRGYLPSMEALIRSWKNPSSAYGTDETFLKFSIWPKAKADVLDHNSNTGSIRKVQDGRFCGEVFNEKDEPIQWTPSA